MDSLLHLFQVDTQVRGLRGRLDSARIYLKAQRKQHQTIQTQHDELAARKKHGQATIANLETEIAAIDERIEKLRGELNSAATNKQYSAVLNELNTVKANRGETEDRVLREMEGIEDLDARMAELVEQLAERARVVNLAAEQLRERESEVGERLAELEAERSQAAAGVPPQHLAAFEHAADMFDGEAMAALEVIDRRRKDYACGACHMTVPFEHVSQLVSGTIELVRCTACSRILYMQEETRGSLAKK